MKFHVFGIHFPDIILIMAAARCVCCGILGCQIFNQHVAALPRPPMAQRRLVTYNMGHGQTTTDENVAKNALLQRDFPEIADLSSISQSEFQPGMIGAKFLPAVFISKIPRVADPSDYEQQYHTKFSQIDPDEHAKNIKICIEQSGEKPTFDGLIAYFKKYSNEDVFVVFNQDICDKTQSNPTWHELDALVVNLTRGYVLVYEAKGNLNKKPLKKALAQLEKTTNIFLMNLASGLNQDWKIIKMIYSADVDPALNICGTCQPYVMSPARGDFVNQLEVILNQQQVKDWSYAKEFHYLVKEILPLRVRIASGLTDLFNMNATIFENIKHNVEAAGTAEMVGFWSQDQLNIAEDSLNLPRILFDSGFSTGKTILMINCMTKLLKNNEKVLYVIHADYYKQSNAKHLPTLLQFKIETYFNQLYQQGVYQDLSHFHVVEVDMSLQSNFNKLFKTHSNFHFFVDEVNFHVTNIVGTRTVRETLGVNYDRMKYWSQRIPPSLHCWIAVCYGKERFNRDELLGQFPKKIGMNKAMRNNEGNVKLVKENINIDFAVASRAGLNDTSKIEELEIPYNLTRTFPTENFLLEANNYHDGFKKVFEALKDIDNACNPSSALIALPWIYSPYCNCYKDNSPQELVAFLAPIYNNFNRPQPKTYLETANVDQAKSWVTSSNKANDLITDHCLVNGFEHPIVVIFNQKGKFMHNLTMRSTTIVVVVDIPYNPWSRKCFHPSGNTNHGPPVLKKMALGHGGKSKNILHEKKFQ